MSPLAGVRWVFAAVVSCDAFRHAAELTRDTLNESVLGNATAALSASKVPSFDMDSEPQLVGEAAEKINRALQVVGKSGSDELRQILKQFEPTYMLAGGTSQAKDSLMMMFMGLPFAFQGQDIATRVPVLYRVLKSGNGEPMDVTMHFEDKLSGDLPSMRPEDVVGTIEQHMGKYAMPSRFGDKAIEVVVSGPGLQTAVYKNMMGRVNGKDEVSRSNEKAIDRIYRQHASERNVMLVAVEQKDHSPKNSMIAPFIAEADPEGKRTVWVKTWADYGLAEKSAQSGKACAEVQGYFRVQDFEKPPGSMPTFWIATVEAEAYLKDPGLSFAERRAKLEEAIAKKEAKMQKFFDDWREKAGDRCTFEFEPYTKVTRLREYLSKLHGSMVMESLPKLIEALDKERLRTANELHVMETQLADMTGANTPGLEVLQLMNRYKGFWDSQWSDDRSAGKGMGLTDTDIIKIQDSEFHMTAPGLAAAIAASWSSNRTLDSQDEAILRRLEAVAGMLSHPPSGSRVSVTGHLWRHLTNMFILLVRSLRDLISSSPQLWRQAAITVVGPNPCHSAAKEAQTTMETGVAEKLGHLMEFSIKWLLRKHQRIVHKLLMAAPANKDYAVDSAFNDELSRAEDSLLSGWADSFHANFYNHLKQASLNVQQFKIQRKLNEMERHHPVAGVGGNEAGHGRGGNEAGHGRDGGQQVEAYSAMQCGDVPGAVGRDRTKFPLCKCTDAKSSVYCGAEKVADRKFNANTVVALTACAESRPRCGTQPVQPAAAQSTVQTTTSLQPVALENEQELKELADLLTPRVMNCGDLYTELVDSAVDQLVLFLGSELNYMAYGSATPINRNIRFAEQMADRLTGGKDDKYVSDRFKSLGKRERMLAHVRTAKTNLRSITESQEYFEQAHMSGQNIVA